MQNKTDHVKLQNLVASAFFGGVANLGDYKLRNENNVPFRIEKISLVSYPCLSVTDR